MLLVVVFVLVFVCVLVCLVALVFSVVRHACTDGLGGCVGVVGICPGMAGQAARRPVIRPRGPGGGPPPPPRVQQAPFLD